MTVAQQILAATLHLAPGLPPPVAMQIASAIDYSAHVHQQSPWIVLALAYEESRLEPTAINNRTNCVGLMQLAPVHWVRQYSRAQAQYIPWNVGLGTTILRLAYLKCGSTEKALAVYGGRRKCMRTPRARMIMRLAKRLEKKFGEASS